MYQEKKRERRIRDKSRMKAKAKFIFDTRLGRFNKYVEDCGRYRAALAKYQKTAEYLAVCSCATCGNARRHFGHKTLQEERFLQRDLY